MIGSSESSSPASRRALRPAFANLPLRRAGRYVVWLVIVVVIARGTLAIVNPPRATRVLVSGAVPAFAPSPQMLWAAGAFTRAYLTVSGSGSDQRAGDFFASAADAQPRGRE